MDQVEMNQSKLNIHQKGKSDNYNDKVLSEDYHCSHYLGKKEFLKLMSNQAKLYTSNMQGKK